MTIKVVGQGFYKKKDTLNYMKLSATKSAISFKISSKKPVYVCFIELFCYEGSFGVHFGSF